MDLGCKLNTHPLITHENTTQFVLDVSHLKSWANLKKNKKKHEMPHVFEN